MSVSPRFQRHSRAKAIIAAALVLGAILAAAPRPVRAEGPRFLGNFTNVTMSPQSGDCGGFSMQLFLQPGTERERLVYGVVHDEVSTCSGPAMRIVEGRFDTVTGRLDFIVDLADEGSWRQPRMRFAGTWRPRGLHLRFAYFDTVDQAWTPWDDTPVLQPIRHLAHDVRLPAKDD